MWASARVSMNQSILLFGSILIRARNTALVAAWGLSLLLTGCVISRNLHAGSTPNGGGSSNFSLSVTPNTLTAAAGGTATATVTVTLNNGFTGTVNLNVSGLPTGATGSLNPMSLSGASSSSTLTVSTTATTPVATTSFTVSGSDSTNQTQNQTVSLAVTAAGAAAATAASSCAISAAGDGGKSASFAPQAGVFTATFEATPSTAPMSAAIGLFQGAAGDNGGLVIFSAASLIQARDGASGELTPTDIPYVAGRTYHFRLVVDQAAHAYSVFVTPPGGSELTLGTDLALPNDRSAVDRLDIWGVHVDDPPDDISRTGTLTVCNFAVR